VIILIIVFIVFILRHLVAVLCLDVSRRFVLSNLTFCQEQRCDRPSDESSLLLRLLLRLSLGNFHRRGPCRVLRLLRRRSNPCLVQLLFRQRLVHVLVDAQIRVFTRRCPGGYRDVSLDHLLRIQSGVPHLNFKL